MSGKDSRNKRAYCTLDVDFGHKPWYWLCQVEGQKAATEKLLVKLASRECVKFIKVDQSPSQCGIHVTVFSDRDCDSCGMCRMAFDDQVRYESDIIHREPWQRDVLFEKKRKITIGDLLGIKVTSSGGRSGQYGKGKGGEDKGIGEGS